MTETFNPMSRAELKVLNDEAINDGVLLPDNAPFSHDSKNYLNKPFAPMEEYCYGIIVEATKHGGFISTREIAQHFCNKLSINQVNDYDIENVWTNIGRIKQKLGETSIITRHYFGYKIR